MHMNTHVRERESLHDVLQPGLWQEPLDCVVVAEGREDELAGSDLLAGIDGNLGAIQNKT